jgi:NAD(P)H-dependent FMN reductase
MYTPKIVALSGSRRTDSFNTRLVTIAAGAARNAGADVTQIDWDAMPLPMYDQDDEAAYGLPDNVKQFRNLLIDADGILISAPEYNSSITPLLKNAIDWASRAEEGDPPLKAFKGKTAALMSASPGALGGLRGLVHVRAILGNIGVLVLPTQLAINKAHEAFDESGRLKDANQQEGIENLGRSLVETVRKLHG